MSDVLIKPAFQSTYPDTGDTTKFGPNAWNAARLFSGGNAGELVVRDTGSATGAAWSATPTLSGLRLGTGVSVPGRITFPNLVNRGPFLLDHSIVSSANPHAYLGYNLDASTWGLIEPTEPGLAWGLEADYDDGSGHHKMEGYLQYQFVAGFGGAGNITYRRPFFTQIDKVTQLIVGTQICGGPVGGLSLGINDGTGSDSEKVVGATKIQIAPTLIGAYVPVQFSSTVAMGGLVNDALHTANIGGTFGDVEAPAGINVAPTYTPTSARTNGYGVLAQPTFAPAANKLAAPSALFAKAYTKPQMALSTTVAHDTLTGLTSRVAVFPGATLGTVSASLSLYVQAPNNEASGPTIIFGRSRGLQIDNVGVCAGNAGVTVESAAGISIAEISGGTISNYGLQLGGTSVPTGGSFSIYNGSANPSYFATRITVGATGGNANAILDLTSTTKAFMPPRMTTTERNAIPSPTAGMVIYNATTNKLNVYTTAWEAVTSA